MAVPTVTLVGGAPLTVTADGVTVKVKERDAKFCVSFTCTVKLNWPGDVGVP
jgi:hypothetical protein